jgi:hypothetical protein
MEEITGAEFRVIRERMGLTNAWLSDYLGVAERSVVRWGDDVSPVPPGVASEMRDLEQRFNDLVEQNLEWLRDVDEVGRGLITYRTDDALRSVNPSETMPASWHRAMAGVVRDRLPGVRIVYIDDSGPEELPPIERALAEFRSTFPDHTDITLETRRCSYCSHANPPNEVHEMIVAFDPTDAGAVRRSERNWCPFGGRTTTGFIVPTTG